MEFDSRNLWNILSRLQCHRELDRRRISFRQRCVADCTWVFNPKESQEVRLFFNNFFFRFQIFQITRLTHDVNIYIQYWSTTLSLYGVLTCFGPSVWTTYGENTIYYKNKWFFFKKNFRYRISRFNV